MSPACTGCWTPMRRTAGSTRRCSAPPTSTSPVPAATTSALSRCGAVRIAAAREPTPVIGRRHTDHAPEMVAQQRRRAEAGTVGDPVDVEIGLFEQAPRVEHPLVGHPLHRCATGLLDESAGE